MDAFELLKDDHRRVSDLFKQVESAQDEKKKLQLFEQIKSELELHTRIEENIFYPAIEKYEQLKDLALEAREEHKQVKTLLREIDRIDQFNDRVKAKLQVLQENVEHHVDEEENEMFPQVRKVMERAELNRLGEQLQDAKQEGMKRGTGR